MKTFGIGMIAGAMLGAGLTMLASPLSKKDVRCLRNNTRRAIKMANRSLRQFM